MRKNFAVVVVVIVRLILRYNCISPIHSNGKKEKDM